MMEALNLPTLATLLPADFHFLRPEWLYALLPALVLIVLAARHMRRGRSDWAGVVDPHLLRHLAVRGRQSGQRWPVAALLIGWVLAIFAMAGPTWQKLPSPALDQLDPTVLVLNLNRSMDAGDEEPSRLIAARHKIEDILDHMRGGQVGLVIYADVPFVAAPLTEDRRVISAMLPELSTSLMPEGANRPEQGILQAAALLQGAGAKHGRIILITDSTGDTPARMQQAARAVEQAGYKVSVIAVGKTGGASAAPPMDEAGLKAVAEAGKGVFTPISIDDRDIDTIFAQPVATTANNPLQDTGMTADTWLDMGSFLLVPVLLLGALAFRRGWLAALLLAVLLPLAAPPVQAQEHKQTGDAAPVPPPGLWQNLWKRPDQQAADAFSKGDYENAARRFEDPDWRASALYRAGQFQEAASAYQTSQGADYNLGNALARAGRLEEALAAYDAALARDPTNEDALFNRDLVEQLLKKEEEEQQDQSGGGGGGSGGGGGESQQQDQQGQGGQNQQQDKDQQQGDTPQDQQPREQDSGKQESPDGKKPGEDGDGAQDKPDSGKDDAPDQKSGAQNDTGPKPEDDPSRDAPMEPGDTPDAPAPEEGKDQQQQKPEPDEKPGPDGDDGQPQDASPQDEKPEESAPESRQPDKPAPQGGGADSSGGQDEAGGPNGGAQPQPMSEQDQNSEQALRMVPDDPAGLLRARIRAYYTGLSVNTEPGN
ncbi:VWA domain-containing protein [Xanthobacter sp. TB0136]|uniref:VWA domain-containing protein n=1 Tax=Xanthobacter sp. TB0136 TaxID=3459177 RepID=UPI00403A5B15